MEEIALKQRSVARISGAQRTLEGEGVPIGRAFPNRSLEDLDPFLLLDHMGPAELAPGEAKGFPNHPHRGFETVTYLLSGDMEHRDSYGNHGRLGPGDVQWMTAGSGLIHSEMPGPEIVRNGGRLEGFQLWVNLPKRDKMMPPRYQELKAESIPVAQAGGITVRVIAGEALGRKGLIQTHLPITYLHIKLQAGAEFAQSVAAQQNAFAYVIRGEAEFGSRAAAEGSVVVFANDGDEIRVKALKDSEALLIAGQPIGEPVARYGPFVMNTRQEIVQAFDDFQQGRMGRL